MSRNSRYNSAGAVLVFVLLAWQIASAQGAQQSESAQACMDRLREGAGICRVGRDAAFNQPLEMKSNATLVFDCGTFTNTNPNGGVFVHFARSVSHAVVRGGGRDCTTLRNSSSGTQFGAVVQDEGTDNTISDMTLDGNGNTTSTFVMISAMRPSVQRLRIVHDRVPSQRNYAWDIRGGGGYDATNVEVVGGAKGAVSITNQDGVGTYGNITGGRFTGLYVHDSPHNGLDVRSGGKGQSISGLEFTNFRGTNNGNSSGGDHDTRDDQFGALFIASLAKDGSSIFHVQFEGVLSGNRGAGLRLKGDVHDCEFRVTSTKNGGGTAPVGAITLAAGEAGTRPCRNHFVVLGRTPAPKTRC